MDRPFEKSISERFTDRIFRSICIVICLFASILLISPISFGSDSQSARADNAQYDTLWLEIQFDEPVISGKETVFTMVGHGGSGQYQFMPYSLRMKEGSYYSQPVVDFSYSSYSDNNTFKYTFTLRGEYELRYCIRDKVTNIATSWNKVSEPVYFSVDDENSQSIDEWKQAANKKADEVVSACLAAGCKTDYEKALWLHDWIIDNCTYDDSLRKYQFYNIFNDREGTCEAYNSAYILLLDKMGLQSGSVRDSGHIWTLVKIDDKWCHIDTTHDDATYYSSYKISADELRHLYFGLDDETIGHALTLNGLEVKSKIPDEAASSLDNSYMIKSGTIKKYSTPLISSVQSKLDSGATSFSIDVPLASMSQTIMKSILYDLVAYDLESSEWRSNDVAKRLSVSYGNDRLNFTVSDVPDKVETVEMYRLYNPYTGEHFYTSDAYEKYIISTFQGWIYEGVAWNAPLSGTPIYRLWNPAVGEHLYTSDAYERDYIVANQGWTYEGIGWYSDGTFPVYRLYHPILGKHHYTGDQYETYIISTYQGWNYEGIGWYGM